MARRQEGHAGARPRRRRSNPFASLMNVLIASVKPEIASPPLADRHDIIATEPMNVKNLQNHSFRIAYNNF